MHTKRTRFAKDILAEFLPPKKESNKVIIFCDGMPGMPGNKKNMLKMQSRGYWSFYPRYRGTWESDGYFLDHDPTDDIRDVVESLDAPFVDCWSGEEFTIVNPEIYLVGISFGGPAAILLSSHPKVKKVVSICGVVDWTDDSEEEPLEWLFDTMQKAFGSGYRLRQSADWKQLQIGALYQPINNYDSIDGSKVLQIHAVDDAVVPYDAVHSFHTKAKTTLVRLKKGGHSHTGCIRNYWMWRKIKKHFKS